MFLWRQMLINISQYVQAVSLQMKAHRASIPHINHIWHTGLNTYFDF